MNRTQRQAAARARRSARQRTRQTPSVGAIALDEALEALSGFTSTGQARCSGCQGVMAPVDSVDFLSRYWASTGREDLPEWFSEAGALFWCDACDRGRALVEGPGGVPLRVNVGGGCSVPGCCG